MAMARLVAGAAQRPHRPSPGASGRIEALESTAQGPDDDAWSPRLLTFECLSDPGNKPTGSDRFRPRQLLSRREANVNDPVVTVGFANTAPIKLPSKGSLRRDIFHAFLLRPVVERVEENCRADLAPIMNSYFPVEEPPDQCAHARRRLPCQAGFSACIRGAHFS